MQQSSTFLWYSLLYYGSTYILSQWVRFSGQQGNPIVAFLFASLYFDLSPGFLCLVRSLVFFFLHLAAFTSLPVKGLLPFDLSCISMYTVCQKQDILFR